MLVGDEAGSARETTYLNGVIDMHVHSSPDVEPRSMDDLDLAAEAGRAGMRAIVLKAHQHLTSTRAYVCQKAVGASVTVFGGLVLNSAVGGLNPEAVASALALNARILWMPTRSSRHHHRVQGIDGGITIFDGSGRLRAEVIEIIDLAHEAGVALASGHLAPEETLALARIARARGLERLIVTHPDFFVINMPVELQRELAAMGCFLERAYSVTTHHGRGMSLGQVVRNIRAVGVESSVLSSDLGMPDVPQPVEGMRRYLAGLRTLGLTDEDIHTMAVTNPAYLLDLGSPAIVNSQQLKHERRVATTVSGFEER